MKCYTSSPELKARLEEANKSKQKDPRACPQCGKVFQHKSKKYCSDVCRRKYFAERFDRWVASPEQIALPQNFDEFMARDILPCLVEGCSWEGENLGYHVNVVHGITADQFRELVGFNRSTGLVGADLRTRISERMKDLIARGVIDINPAQLTAQLKAADVSRFSFRLEGREHLLKARALLAGMESPRHPRQCLQCGVDVPQPYFGQVFYCSTQCRSRYYQEQGSAELRCDYCGEMFMGLLDQVRRAQSGGKVCCSMECRNRMNMVACLAARGIKWGKSV